MDIDGHRDRICADPETCGYPVKRFQSMREVCSLKQSQGVFSKNAEIFEDSFQNSHRKPQTQGDVPKLEISPHGNEDRHFNVGGCVTGCPTHMPVCFIVRRVLPCSCPKWAS